MFKVVKQKDGRFTFLSHHGHFLSAQPNGTFQVNRREAKEWEMFTVEEAQFEEAEGRFSVSSVTNPNLDREIKCNIS